MKYNELKDNIAGIFGNKNFRVGLTIFILLAIIILSSSVRVSNLNLLKDTTTGEYVSADIDAFYFIRVAETIIENNGSLPAFDDMRSPSTNVPWIKEVLPQTMVGVYNIMKIFNQDVTIQYVGMIIPVILFVIGIIIFFFLALVLSNKKSIALVSTAILAFAPSYLFRTMAGVGDHDVFGMVAVFSFFLVYALSLKNFEKNWKNVIMYSLFSGAMITFVLITWSGAITFVLTTMPFAFLMYWFYVKRDNLKTIAFYGLLLLSSTIFPTIFGFDWNDMLNRFIGSYGLLVPFVMVFILIDFGFLKMKNSKFKIGEKDILYSLVSTAILGLIGLQIINKSIITVIKDIWFKLINPFGNAGGGRLGSTVAENAQPFLVDWIGQSGQIVFWMFILGMFILGFDFASNIKKNKVKSLFITAWIFVTFSIMFSRISPTSMFNGNNFISHLIYSAGLLFFAFALFFVPFKEKFKADSSIVLFLSIIFFTLINGRSATRIFFLIAPFVSFSAAYSIGRLYDYAKNSKEEISRIIFWGLFVLGVIGVALSITSSYVSISNQAKYTGPSADGQWQSAMEWVRNNTGEKDIFVHWWDYGYWIQSLGKRPTVTDGGHSGGDQADHYIGRYVLTTTNPDSAMSYMKTWNVSYLLIDQTDLGKYPAYSLIGGGSIDENDRYAAIPVMPNDPKQTRETANGTTIVFSGGMYLFEDITWNDGNKNIFLPAGKAAVVGVIMNIEGDNLRQPEAVYIYNGIQTRIPVRYVYVNERILDFKNGLDVVIDVIPAFTGNGINQLGAAIYLSEKVSRGLFARLYLLDDAFGEYEGLKLVHSEESLVVASLRAQGVDIGEFVYYQGFRGPIKIWGVSYSDDVEVVPEFKDDLGRVYARFDERFY
jgi:asparagine N-glycosylation enzyme membrane subunit Stt3